MTECPLSGSKDYDWVRHQRRMYSEKTLPDIRIRLLEEISWWTWNTYATQFDDRIGQLRQLNTPPKSRTDEYEIAKYFRKRKSLGKLESERVEELEAISWWTW